MNTKTTLLSIHLAFLVLSGTALANQTDAISPPMVNIPAGKFMMGTTGGDTRAYPAHQVHIAAFQLGKYEVTVAEFRKFALATGYTRESTCNDFMDAEGLRGPTFQGQGRWDAHRFSYSDYQPVTCISWQDAKAYTQWLSDQTGHPYRLPTEAEWEYATKANTTSRHFWGDDLAQNQACLYGNFADLTGELVNNQQLGYSNKGFVEYMNCDDGEAYNAIVGLYRPNPFGLYDMMGNVSEFLDSCYSESGYTVTEPLNKPNTCEFVAHRGGTWHYPAGLSANRGRYKREGWNVDNSVGFRVARDGHSSEIAQSTTIFESELAKAQQARLQNRDKLVHAPKDIRLTRTQDGLFNLSWSLSNDPRVTSYDIYRSKVKLAHLTGGLYHKYYEKIASVEATTTQQQVSLPNDGGSFIVVARTATQSSLASESAAWLAQEDPVTIPGRINMDKVSELSNVALYHFAATTEKPARYLVFKTNKETDEQMVTMRFKTKVATSGWYTLNYKGSSFQHGEFFKVWQGRHLAGIIEYNNEIDDSTSNRHQVYLEAGEQMLELSVLKRGFDRWGLSWLDLNPTTTAPNN